MYDQYQGAASDASDVPASDDPLAGLANSIPGVPGEDYPIYSEVPETAFACDGQVNGGENETKTKCQTRPRHKLNKKKISVLFCE